MTRDDENQIGAALKGYTEGFLACNIEALIGLWDSEAGAEVSYRPAESNEIMIGLPRLREYYKKIEGDYVLASGALTNFVVRDLGGSMAYVLCDFAWRYSTRSNPNVSIDFNSRGSIIMRKRGNHWRYLHMHESSLFIEPT